MTQEHDHDHDESRLNALLHSVDADAAPPDPGVLLSLRQRAADEFERAATGASGGVGVVSDSRPITGANAAAEPRDPPPPHVKSNSSSSIRLHRRSPMLTLVLRGALALSATVALLAVWLNPLVPKSVDGAPFSAVLEGLRGAATLHLQLEKAGQTSEILVRAPGLVRKQDSPQRYQIAAGSRWWKVDESENTVVAGDSPWFLSADRQVDLLGLLEVGVKDASSLLVARPLKRATFHGQECFAYRVAVPGERGRIQIEAFADVANNQLVGIIARDPNAPAQGPPLAELRLIALNPAVADEQFAVAKSLTEDGRIGKIGEAQGIVVLRPALARRWTPVCRETLLRPGDWLRTEARGANAVKVTLSSEVELTLGPGTLIECISPSQTRLHNGQVQVRTGRAAADGKPRPDNEGPPSEFTLLAPRDGKRLFQPGLKQLVRVDRDEKIVNVPQTPIWLAGFEGTTNNESLGSLIVNLPDGRNEPLTVGYHKVSVEIRDQIARTTIEESFVNHTLSRLEGVFHFPLPQDASISGFGMWIGNDLVEADVVEKQRAREIFETILREKRDPGLLEWMGGNIFKARVFPIEAQSEKRIKIVYTQVLPLRANRYRYSYGLRSELLRTKPLRELSLSVTVNSALPLKNVACPTHTVRALQTAHSAQVDFSAQEYVPTRDFEVVCEVDGKQSDVVVIPHRRGSDGYFLMQLTPPAPDGNWQRELLPDGKPLNIVLLCDTSSSMDVEKRRQQSEFVGSVLTSLGDDDRFQIVCADVGTVWYAPELSTPNADNIAKARAFLEERLSMGWTNLDRAFSDVIKKAPDGAQVIYIGDGIVSAGTTDPAAFVQKLTQLIGASGDAGKGPRRTFHSVTVGNSHETVVLKGIAAAGGGSTRAIGGEQTPQAVALELLNEIAQPGLRDLNVEFRGLKVAAVYPGRLPNVAAGTQQILVGRYLPEGKDQSGEIIVTGLRGTEKVKFAARVNLKDAEEGNSFIPRFWARAHLDQLLAQGQGAAIRDEIIGMSEEFHIITPYTSLLVLETDADRERFGVKRRYEMRDGERFFAEGRSNANFELVQAQMKRAGNWRLGLRRRILAGLKNLGRDSQDLQQHLQIYGEQRRAGAFGPGMLDEVGKKNGSPYQMEGFAFGRSMSRMNAPYGDVVSYGGGLAGDFAGSASGDGFGLDGGFLGDSLGALAGEPEDAAVAKEMKDAVMKTESLSLGLGDDDRKSVSGGDFDSDELSDLPGQMLGRKPMDQRGLRMDFAERQLGEAGKMKIASIFSPQGYRDRGRGTMDGLGGGGGGSFEYYRYQHSQSPDYTSWINVLFPALPVRPAKEAAPPENSETWSAEAIAISRSLLRTEGLKKFDGGVELRRVFDYFDPRWNRKSSHQSDLVLYSSTGWLSRSLDANVQTIVNYCTPQERGVYSLAFLLGRKRTSAAPELEPSALALNDYSLSPLHLQLRDRLAKIEAGENGQVKLVLTIKDSTQVEHLWINAARHVLVKQESFSEGRLTGKWQYDDFVEIAGSWWARTGIHTDADGRKTAEFMLELKPLSQPQFAERMDAELAARPQVQFIQIPFATIKSARQKVADGGATFDHRLAMILHKAQEKQQWDDVWKHVDAVEQQGAGKPGIRWIRTTLQTTIRKNEEARARLLDELRQLVAKRQQDEFFLTEYVLGQAHGATAWPEFLEFVEMAKPIYERQAAELDAMPSWKERRAQCYEGMSQYEEMLSLRRSLAESAPWHVHWQSDYARRLSQAGRFDAAVGWLQREVDRPVQRPEYEDETLRSALVDLYRGNSQWAPLLKFTTEWIGRKPESMSYNSAYAQHLSALVFNNQLDQAMALIQKWFDESRIKGKLAPDQRARLEAALNFAMGNSYYLSFQRMDERWIAPLGELVRFFARHPHHADIASRIMSHQFQSSDVADRLRGEFFTLLQTDLATLSASQISNMVSWTLSGRIELPEPIQGRKQLEASEIPSDAWKKIATALKPRWEQSQEKGEKNSFSESLRSIYSHRFADSLLLPFLRERIATAHPDYKPSYLATLFDTLLTTGWTPEIEKDAFARLRDLSTAKEPIDRLQVQLPALYRLIDAMLANRQSAAERVLSDQGGQDKLTRKELGAKKEDIARTARRELSQRLAEESKQEDGPLSRWFRIEQTWVDAQLGQNLPEILQFCWQILGDAPPKLPVAAADADDDAATVIEQQNAQAEFEMQFKSDLLESILRQRAFATVMNLANRRKAAPEEISRVLKYIDAGIAQSVLNAPQPDGEQPAPRGDAGEAWRLMKFQFLVALDRPDDLDRELRQWIRDDVSTAPWRQALARLVAERGQLDEAIQLFEACEKDRLLSASDYKMLSDWYQVTDRRAAFERARIESLKQMPEHQLNRRIYQIANRWQQHAPSLTELDEDSLFAFKALFEKSASPENYLWQLRNVYAASRDFRLLQMLPDAMLGRSPQQVYSFLQQLNGQILYELRNEAPADEILSRIRTLRAAERTVTDLRALDLLEALVERKSSEVLNQPGPHVEACVAALQRAFARKWGDGEPRMMSNFLYQLGGLPAQLEGEQLRELKELQKLAPVQSRDHLLITNDLCNLIGGTYRRVDEAIRIMEAEVRSYSQANAGKWPHQDNHVLGSYVSLYEQANRDAAAESVLQTFLVRPEHLEQRKWLDDRLMSVYNHALEHDGAVSLGSGRAGLFDPLLKLILKQLGQSADENERYNLVSRLVGTFDIAHRHGLKQANEAVQSFAFETMPALLKRQTAQYRNTVNAPLGVILAIAGPKAALRYVVERIEQYPQRLEISWENSWQSLGYELARQREAAGRSDLDARIRTLAIRELKRELRTGEARYQALYYQHQQYFWNEKAAEFAMAAEEVLAEQRSSGRRAMSVARYMWHGLGRTERSIEILFVAHRQGILDESGQVHLIQWLHETDRFAESIPLLEVLVGARPENMGHRTRLMTAYFRSKRPEQLLDQIQQTHDYFHEGGRWNEGNVALFGSTCFHCRQLERAVLYLTEAIALHQRANPGGGLNDGGLANYYRDLAHANSQLGRTKDAVDAASAAIVCWSGNRHERADHVNTLNHVLANAQDLDNYVAHLDEEAAKSGQDSPILRQAIGVIYQGRGQFEKAIVQLRLAIELQPHDTQTHQSLMVCYDATQNGPAATRQLLRLIDLKPHDLGLYLQLADRLKDNEVEAERAVTSIIEASPGEAENHAAMAERRQSQGRWAEAIPHWEKVAELRKLEPNGLLKLAAAQIHEQQWDSARESVNRLRKIEWPARFNDVQSQATQLEAKIPKK